MQRKQRDLSEFLILLRSFFLHLHPLFPLRYYIWVRFSHIFLLSSVLNHFKRQSPPVSTTPLSSLTSVPIANQRALSAQLTSAATQSHLLRGTLDNHGHPYHRQQQDYIREWWSDLRVMFLTVNELTELPTKAMVMTSGGKSVSSIFSYCEEFSHSPHFSTAVYLS